MDDNTKIKIIENQVKFSKHIGEMHSILIELMQACLDEIKSQIKKYEGLSSEHEKCLTIESALLKSFIGQLKGAVGKNFVNLGYKTKALIKNVNDVRRLIWLLLNLDCITFFNYLTDLRQAEL